MQVFGKQPCTAEVTLIANWEQGQSEGCSVTAAPKGGFQLILPYCEAQGWVLGKKTLGCLAPGESTPHSTSLALGGLLVTAEPLWQQLQGPQNRRMWVLSPSLLRQRGMFTGM